MSTKSPKFNYYQTKAGILPGSKLTEVYHKAINLFSAIKRKSKRKTYLRSAYFRKGRHKEKIFFDYFWKHLHQKTPKERFKRLKYFAAALEVIEHSRNHPLTRPNPNKLSEALYRFGGITREGYRFYIQIKEHKPTRVKQIMSVFAAK